MEISNALSTAAAVMGHVSFALTFLAYAQRDIIRLRMIAVASLVCGLAYNGWVQYHMTGNEDIWLVIGWLTIFLLQNIALLVREIREGLELTLDATSRAMLFASFPSMHSRDWRCLQDKAIIKKFAPGAVILDVGDATDSLQLIASGRAVEYRNEQERTCSTGTLWGELTYVMGEDHYNQSPVKIVAVNEVVVFTWPYPRVRKMAEKNLRFNAALQHGFVLSAGLKHGLLWMNTSNAKP